jgi:hypothetical protein
MPPAVQATQRLSLGGVSASLAQKIDINAASHSGQVARPPGPRRTDHARDASARRLGFAVASGSRALAYALPSEASEGYSRNSTAERVVQHNAAKVRSALAACDSSHCARNALQSAVIIVQLSVNWLVG